MNAFPLFCYISNDHNYTCVFRLSPGEKSMPIRVFITSDNGVSVRTHMYKEVEDPRTGEVREGGRQGREGGREGGRVGEGGLGFI